MLLDKKWEVITTEEIVLKRRLRNYTLGSLFRYSVNINNNIWLFNNNNNILYIYISFL
jgi:hypothetical protein